MYESPEFEDDEPDDSVWLYGEPSEIIVAHGRAEKMAYVVDIIEVDVGHFARVASTWEEHGTPSASMRDAVSQTMKMLAGDEVYEDREFIFYFECMLPACEGRHHLDRVEVEEFLAGLPDDAESSNGDVFDNWLESLQSKE